MYQELIQSQIDGTGEIYSWSNIAEVSETQSISSGYEVAAVQNELRKSEDETPVTF